ncbi:uncharacterized protein TNCV_1345641 [Trichonephila clavipes]|nr:uncharacterized protein TNCV_1345641 [Trichonephila clavipes]
MSNSQVSISGFNVIYPFCINTKNRRTRTTYQACCFEDIRCESLRTITIYSLSNSLRPAAFILARKSKSKNDSLPSPAAVKCHFLLTAWLPRHPDEFNEKCGGVHNVLARQRVFINI